MSLIQTLPKFISLIYLSYLIFIKSKSYALLALSLDSVVGDCITRSVVVPWSGPCKSTPENVSA